MFLLVTMLWVAYIKRKLSVKEFSWLWERAWWFLLKKVTDSKGIMFFVCSASLRYLNASANSLESLPSACAGEESLSVLQLLYLTNNLLTDQCIPVLVGHPHLRILHLANNQLQTFPARWMSAVWSFDRKIWILHSIIAIWP